MGDEDGGGAVMSGGLFDDVAVDAGGGDVVDGEIAMEIETMQGLLKQSTADVTVAAWLAKTNGQSLATACREAGSNNEFSAYMRSYLVDPAGTYSEEAIVRMSSAREEALVKMSCASCPVDSMPPDLKSPAASAGCLAPPRAKAATIIVHAPAATAGGGSLAASALRAKAGHPKAPSTGIVLEPSCTGNMPFRHVARNTPPPSFLDATWILQACGCGLERGHTHRRRKDKALRKFMVSLSTARVWRAWDVVDAAMIHQAPLENKNRLHEIQLSRSCHIDGDVRFFPRGRWTTTMACGDAFQDRLHIPRGQNGRRDHRIWRG